MPTRPDPQNNISIGPEEVGQARLDVMGHLADELARTAYIAVHKVKLDMPDIHCVLAAATVIAAINTCKKRPECRETVSEEILLTVYHSLKQAGIPISNKITVRME